MDWLVCDQGFFLFGLNAVVVTDFSKNGVANSKTTKYSISLSLPVFLTQFVLDQT
jgi:hypothetical protein